MTVPKGLPQEPQSCPVSVGPPEMGLECPLTVCFPLRWGAGRPLGVQPHTGSSSEEGARVPGWHQGTLGACRGLGLLPGAPTALRTARASASAPL